MAKSMDISTCGMTELSHHRPLLAARNGRWCGQWWR